MSVDSSPARSHLHAIVGLAERVVAESSDPLAQELGLAISQQSRCLLGELAWTGVGHDTVDRASTAVHEPPARASIDSGFFAPDGATQVVDASVLATLADQIGSQDIVATLVDTFLGELGERIAAIQAGAADRGEHACRAAHTLKGTAATMGATELTNIAAELEHQFRSGEGEPDRLVSQLPGAGERCRTALGNVVSAMTERRPVFAATAVVVPAVVDSDSGRLLSERPDHHAPQPDATADG